MSLVELLLVFIVAGIVLWAVNTYLPLDDKIKTLLNIVFIGMLVYWVLQQTGLLSSLNQVRVN